MIVGYRTHAEASVELHRQIVAKFGSDPAVLDDLRIQCLPVTHEGNNRKGHALAAYPSAEGAKSSRLLMVYYGDEPGEANV